MRIQAFGNHGAARLVAVLALGTLVSVGCRRGTPYPAAGPLTGEAIRLRQQAVDLNNRGELLEEQGRYTEANKALEQALEEFQRLYPADRYPQGHPDLAGSLH